jgi:hypothetical protein
MSLPIIPKNINVANFKYSEPKILTSGAKSVYINYGTGKLKIQTPLMYLPYGVSEGGFEDKNAKVDIITAGKLLHDQYVDSYESIINLKGK